MQGLISSSAGNVVRPSFLVDSVTKKYVLKSGDTDDGLFRRNRHSQTVRALRGVSFYAEPGDFLGLLGQNGSGKSTILRLLAGQERPTTGEIYTNARPALLGISAAMQTYLTGRKNVELGCLALGMSPAEVEEVTPSILEFADIGEAIDRPMKTYSAGMSGRLKFAISTAVEPEILLIDEALSAGDASFAERARQRINRLTDRAGVAVLVSHSTQQIKTMCNRSVWLHEGKVISDGDVQDVASKYDEWAKAKSKGDLNSANKIILEMKRGYRQPEYSFLV